MGEIIFYQKYIVPIPYKYKVGESEYEGLKQGEFICKDDRVEKFWFFGGMSIHDDNTAVMYAAFIFKDGSRHELKIELGREHEIEQAEEFLKSIR